METVTLKLPPRLLKDAARVAHGDDVTVGHLVRALLAREVARRLKPTDRKVTDETLLAALQALLARDMAEAVDWEDLARRLARHGYELRPAGGGVVLHKSSCGTRVCKGSELGFAYKTLVDRFGVWMPGHPKRDMGFGDTVAVPDAKPLTSTEKGRIQRALEPIFKAATDWDGLAGRLARRKYEVRPMGTGLAIYALPQGRHVCNTATVGYGYRALVKKFGAPMPGHPHGAEGVPVEEELAFEVIERE